MRSCAYSGEATQALRPPRVAGGGVDPGTVRVQGQGARGGKGSRHGEVPHNVLWRQREPAVTTRA